MTRSGLCLRPPSRPPRQHPYLPPREWQPPNPPFFFSPPNSWRPAGIRHPPPPPPNGISTQTGRWATVISGGPLRFWGVSNGAVGVWVKGGVDHAAAVATTMDPTGAVPFSAAAGKPLFKPVQRTERAAGMTSSRTGISGMETRWSGSEMGVSLGQVLGVESREQTWDVPGGLWRRWSSTMGSTPSSPGQDPLVLLGLQWIQSSWDQKGS